MGPLKSVFRGRYLELIILLYTLVRGRFLTRCIFYLKTLYFMGSLAVCNFISGQFVLTADSYREC